MKRWLVLIAICILLAPAIYGTKRFMRDRRQAEMQAEMAKEPIFATSQDRDQGLIAQSKVYEGPLRSDDDERVVSTRVIAILSQLPEIEALQGDGIRLIGFLEAHNYAVSMSLPAPDAHSSRGILLVLDNSTDSKRRDHALKRHTFSLPRAEYLSIMKSADGLMDNYSGAKAIYRLGRDGTPIYRGSAFERIRGKRISSGIALSNPHYDRLQEIILSMASAHAGEPYPFED